MKDKISPATMSGLSSTLLITLWAKAVELGRADALLHDEQAQRMMQMIDYDFKKFESAKLSQPGCCGRALIIDNETQRFIEQHPNAVAVQLGAGLDARFERLGKPKVTWYDLDLPEVIAIRHQLLPENGNHYVAASMFDTGWMKEIATLNRPVLLILEGVLMYFPEKEVRAFFETVTSELPNLTVVFDSLPAMGVGRAEKHDALHSMDNEDRPEFLWGPSDLSVVEQWQNRLKITAVHHLSDVCAHRYPWYARWMYKLPCAHDYLDQRIVVMESELST